MTLTLLLDLDDTLLDTNMEMFMPAYLQALGKHLAPYADPGLLVPAVLAGTQSMLANENPALTLKQVFDLEFNAQVGIGHETLAAPIEDFYDHAFTLLSGVTGTRPGAAELVDWALDQGFRVAVATDPLFPLKANLERIRWAGLDPARFELISSYETFHFTKSHPAFYAELLGRLGWPNGPVLMVGNDEERDLRCAQGLGLPTYQVQAASQTMKYGKVQVSGTGAPVGRGSLVDLRQWLETTDLAALEPSLKNRDATLAILRSTPAVLRGLTAGLDEHAWRYEPTPADWAIIEIVSHLRDTEWEVHHAQIQTLREAAKPFVPRPDAAVWAKQRDYLKDAAGPAIESFTEARLRTLDQVESLTSDDWNKPAGHAIFGPTTFGEVLGFMADHDRLHIQQAWETLHAAA